MAATYCTESELRANLQLGSLYSSATVEETCQAGENIIKSYLWFNRYNIVSQEATTTTATIYTDEIHNLYVGETIVVENCGSRYNGTKTITEVTEYSMTYTVSNGNAQVKHLVLPYGTATATTHIDYSSVPEIKLATLMVCNEIWQAKQAANGGALDPNFQPSPFKMGSTLIAKVRGLLANHLAPNGLIG
jgi:hypothetical protein